MRALLALTLAGCWSSASPPPAPPAPPVPVATETPREQPAETASEACDEMSCLLQPDPVCCARYQQPTPGPGPGPQPQSQASLDRNQIQTAIQMVKPRLRRCGDAAPAAKGTLKVRVTVDPAGTPTTTIVQGLDAAIDACVVGVLDGAQFPPAQAPTTFSYPFVY